MFYDLQPTLLRYQTNHPQHEEKSLISDDLKANFKCYIIKQHR